MKKLILGYLITYIGYSFKANVQSSVLIEQTATKMHSTTK